ncbi:MAG: OsmC family protein [Candidatus Omnitrophica bacterium]|nr:OsmC family protein [Candidatus Omnitrophota bacterium]MBU1923581.1 OsmC family protein [Candidatus Omnitrophota bacterium]
MYKVEIVHNQDLAFSVKAGESEFTVDAKGRGLTPLDALLAGLGSCIGVYIRKYADGSKLSLENFKINIFAELSKESPLAFRQISVEIDLKSCSIDERRQRALLEFIRNCPAHNTLKANPLIEFKLTC